MSDSIHVHLLADSHGRDIRQRVEVRLSGDKVGGISGAPMNHYFKNIAMDHALSTRRKKKTLNVIMGGVNDSSKDSVSKKMS
jgi:hypothetical protein